MNSAVATQVCKNCQYVIQSDSAESGWRCGWEYFQIPPLERKAKRMTEYGEVEATDHCDKWDVSARNA